MFGRLTLVLVVATVVVVVAPARVAACTCGGTSEYSALEHADVVFIGVVSEVRDGTVILDPTYTSSMKMYTFAVEESLKGDPGDFAVIRSFPNEAGCGIPMAVGERWEIYAHREDLFGNVRAGELWVWLCDANQRLATGVPVPPVPGSFAPIMVVGVAAAGLLALGALASRRRLPPADAA